MRPYQHIRNDEQALSRVTGFARYILESADARPDLRDRADAIATYVMDNPKAQISTARPDDDTATGPAAVDAYLRRNLTPTPISDIRIRHRMAEQARIRAERNLKRLLIALGLAALFYAVWLLGPFLFGWIIERAANDAAIAAQIMRF